MTKRVLIVNGMARCGKDTFAELLGEFVEVRVESAIDKVKEIAKLCGWSGIKDEQSRAFLSELKMLTTKYYKMSYLDILSKYEAFMQDNCPAEVLIIFCREPKDIAELKKACNAITVHIENNRVPRISSNFGDAHVDEYAYDCYIANNGTMDEYRLTVEKFYHELLP